MAVSRRCCHLLKQVRLWPCMARGHVLAQRDPSAGLPMSSVLPSMCQVPSNAYSSGSSDAMLCQELKHRSLVRVSGEDTKTFLQGLVTNDMTCLDGDCSTLYAFLLNVQGRIVYDLILYNVGKTASQPTYLLECHADATADLMKDMKRYKIRKKVDMSPVGDEYRVWSVIPGRDCCSQDRCTVQLKGRQAVVCSSDPRLKSFGCRMILPAGTPGSSVLENAVDVADQTVYHERRYKIGLGEGPLDLPPGQCFPLECNAVFLNGVSFNKGCYIGQELTARIHHTGVIRKRLMPIEIHSAEHGAAAGDTVMNASGKNCGKYRNSVGKYGLALLRVANVIGKGPLSIETESGEAVEASTHVPYWWPEDPTTEEVEKMANAQLQS